MWPYVADIQRDFAARAGWADAETFAEGEHAPALAIPEGTDFRAGAGQDCTFHAQAASPDGPGTEVSIRVYPEISAGWAAEAAIRREGDAFTVTVPASTAAGDELHLILKAQAGGRYRLVSYRHVIIRAE